VDELRSLVRRLLKAFVAFAANPPQTYNKGFFNEHFDVALLEATEREKLRTALGLNCAIWGSMPQDCLEDVVAAARPAQAQAA
jgi:hypothetical protein